MSAEPVSYENATDAQIMEGVRAGDGRAIAALYDRYHGLIFSLGLRMLNDREGAEELVQEVFLRAWRQAATYQPALGRLSTWLLGIARNLAVDELRRRGARPQRADGDSDIQLATLAAPESTDPAEQTSLAARRDEIRRALDALPAAQRQVMDLAYYGGLTQSEIAARLGEPLGTVKTRMRLGTQKLRDQLQEMNQG
ncbi:MAG TPA: sigma-70 family RNA polymerase sigma factor [Chloroflexota bacterium]|nr:sigma-70 family RNA polymerase sigma factor [Chloroflexota bacterium]